LKIFLEFRSVADHNREDQFDVLFSILQEYGIVRKLRAVIDDNSGINDIFCRAIKAYFRKEKEDLQ
jgi:hypothetical protein